MASRSLAVSSTLCADRRRQQEHRQPPHGARGSWELGTGPVSIERRSRPHANARNQPRAGSKGPRALRRHGAGHSGAQQASPGAAPGHETGRGRWGARPTLVLFWSYFFRASLVLTTKSCGDFALTLCAPARQTWQGRSNAVSARRAPALACWRSCLRAPRRPPPRRCAAPKPAG